MSARVPPTRQRIPVRVLLAGLFIVVGSAIGWAQPPEPHAEARAAIRACAANESLSARERERTCLFNLVAQPCTQRREGWSNLGSANCYRSELRIWDDLLNENFRALRATLDDDQKAKLREMQLAWISYRDTTCNFYYDKIRGSMAIPMISACLARETARRALLLTVFAQF